MLKFWKKNKEQQVTIEEYTDLPNWEFTFVNGEKINSQTLRERNSESNVIDITHLLDLKKKKPTLDAKKLAKISALIEEE